MAVSLAIYRSFEHGMRITLALSGGKSAILAGIAVGLGGKASVTGRGTGVTSLIQEGKRYVFGSQSCL